MTRRIVRRPAAEEEAEESEEREEESEEQEEPRDVVRSGWGGWKKTKSKASGFAEFFRPDKEAQLLKFLEPEPFASFQQHWLEREGKKSFVCLEDQCALCDIGDRPSFRTQFNVLVIDGDEPQVRVWEVGPRESERLANLADEPRTGPLNKDGLYWAVSRTGTKSKTSYQIEPVKERDLEAEFQVEPLTDDQLAKFARKKYTSKVVGVSTAEQLKAIAEELLDEG